MDREVRLELQEVHKELGAIWNEAEKLNAQAVSSDVPLVGVVCDLLASLATQVRVLARYVEKLVEKS